jgi:hypothetical protein
MAHPFLTPQEYCGYAESQPGGGNRSLRGRLRGLYSLDALRCYPYGTYH